MRNIKITIEYDGTDFCGWQIQEKGKRTVQGELETVLSKIFKSKTKIFGSGRTDSGVHALGQVANFKTKSAMTPSQIVKALNAWLPEDIAVHQAEEVDENFHAQFSAKSKIYRYTILTAKTRRPQIRKTSLYNPFPLKLNVMKKEAQDLLGKKDFRSFQAADSAEEIIKGEKSTVRTIKGIAFRRSQNLIFFEIEANGFLYKMVRNIVGTLLEIGSGRRAAGTVKTILKSKTRMSAGQTAEPRGLCLLKVNY